MGSSSGRRVDEHISGLVCVKEKIKISKIVEFVGSCGDTITEMTHFVDIGKLQSNLAKNCQPPMQFGKKVAFYSQFFIWRPYDQILDQLPAFCRIGILPYRTPLACGRARARGGGGDRGGSRGGGVRGGGARGAGGRGNGGQGGGARGAGGRGCRDIEGGARGAGGRGGEGGGLRPGDEPDEYATIPAPAQQHPSTSEGPSTS
ncbi:uncharacterized protein LOC132037154 [Lycium ferocissimum]|uniref:uncharacterized protein LOC132037154 n=1 Tax=Lycium ferocissimum TaxID=112874 RepID=UPI002816911F|nr:uncharacterized protein LOC132037154 [Lycium ferocissimum]